MAQPTAPTQQTTREVAEALVDEHWRVTRDNWDEKSLHPTSQLVRAFLLSVPSAHDILLGVCTAWVYSLPHHLFVCSLLVR